MQKNILQQKQQLFYGLKFAIPPLNLKTKANSSIESTKLKLKEQNGSVLLSSLLFSTRPIRLLIFCVLEIRIYIGTPANDKQGSI